MQATENNTPFRRMIFGLVAITLVSILLRTVFAKSIGQFWPNFTPIAALALFSGAMLWNHKWMFVFPVGAMLISDTIKEIMAPGTGFYPDMVYVYGAFFAILCIGTLIRNSRKPLYIFAASLSGSILFFLVTNFGAWTSIPEYSKDFSGLMQSYTMGLPFFKYTVLGDLFYNAVFFGGYFLLVSKNPVQTQKA